jgi:predicted nuclease of predicted toxin-antitoxin system
MATPAMQFLLDNNVPDSVARYLRGEGHTVHLVRDVLLPDSPDPVIATVSEENGWVLVSADRDFDKIAPQIPKGSRARFKRLSRISLRCSEYQAAALLEEYMEFVELQYERCRRKERAMRIVIQNDGVKIMG